MNDLMTAPENMNPAERDRMLNELEEVSNDLGGARYPYMNFKLGRYVAGSDQAEIDIGNVVCMDLWNLLTGWKKWVNNTLADENIGVRTKGYRKPKRGELGSMDKSQWEFQDDGVTPSDPWTEVCQCLVWFADGHSPLDIDQAIFDTSSAGGRGAIGDLYAIWLQRVRLQPAAMPVVKLQRGQFTFTNKAGKKIEVQKPVFELIGWTDAKSWENGNSFEPKDAPKPAAQQAVQSQPIQEDTGPPFDPLDDGEALAGMGVSMPETKRNF